MSVEPWKESRKSQKATFLEIYLINSTSIHTNFHLVGTLIHCMAISLIGWKFWQFEIRGIDFIQPGKIKQEHFDFQTVQLIGTRHLGMCFLLVQKSSNHNDDFKSTNEKHWQGKQHGHGVLKRNQNMKFKNCWKLD